MVMGPTGGGGNTLGTAQGRIQIDVSNVQQAAQTVRQAAADMTAAFNAVNQSARLASQGVGLMATQARQLSGAVQASNRAAASAANQAARSTKQTADNAGLSIQRVLNDLNKFDQQMQRAERKAGVRRPMTGSAGAFVLPTIGATEALRQVEQFDRQMQRAEASVRGRFRNMQQSATEFGRSLQQVAGQMFVFSVAAGVLVAGGLRAANTMQAMEIRFRALEGSSEAAEARIAALTEEARRFNLPLTEVLAGIARLQPLLKQTGNETNRFVGLVARLATINPVQGAEGAAIAIGEALSGTGNDFYSLQERFNIPRNLIRQAIAETDNFADALDSVLNQLGATEQTAIEFGSTFQGAFRAGKDELFRLIGEGLKPMMALVTPIIRGFADVAASINETSPVLATVLSTTLTLTAAMAPLLYAVGKLAEMWGTVSIRTRAAAIAQRGLRAAGIGLAVAGGVQLGLAVNSLAGGESQDSAIQRIETFIGQSVAIIAGSWQYLTELITTAFDGLGSALDTLASIVRSTTGQFQELFGKLQEWIGEVVGDTNLTMAGRANINAGRAQQYTENLLRSGDPFEQLTGRLVLRFPELDPNVLYQAVQEWVANNPYPLAEVLGVLPGTEEYQNMATAMSNATQAGADLAGQLNAAFDALNIPRTFSQRNAASGATAPQFSSAAWAAAVDGIFQTFMSRVFGRSGTTGSSNAPAAEATTSFGGFNTEQVNAFKVFRDDMARLQEQYHDDVLREEQQYLNRRNQIILDYNEKVVEAQEDEFRRRQEAEEDLAREIAEVQEDSAADQTKAVRDLEAEKAKILRESRIRVLEAASRLDARAVFEEQRRTRARLAELDTEFSAEQDERKRQTTERIKDMQDEFAREEAQRSADFQRRLADMERQKNRELQQLQQQHYNTLSELQQQFNRERSLRNQQFVSEFNELAGHNGRMLATHRLGQFQIEYELMAWYNRMQRTLAGQTQFSQQSLGGVQVLGYQYGAPTAWQPGGTIAPTQYQTGTSYVPSTGMYGLHRGEGVLTPEANAFARRMLGGDYTQAQLVGLMGGGASGAGASYDFSGMQIVLGDVGERSDAQVAAMIEEGLYQFFTRATVRGKAMVA